jgi:prepilin-type N-terminal cleavage/methylation domain-containing protein
MMHATSPLPRPAARASRGFTLAELLLASVLGAMLLTALAVSTFGFTTNLDYLETKAGVGTGIDPVLRRMTREIREAWFVEHPEAQRLRLTHPDGSATEYFVEGRTLKVTRPNGDEGVVYDGLDALTFETGETPRKREGPPVDHDGAWIAKPAGASPIAYTVPVDGELALGFVAPAIAEDVPALGVTEEQVKTVSSSTIELPIARINAPGADQIQISLYESWAPGVAKPYGTPLVTTSVAGASLPQAVMGPSGYEAPTAMVPFTLPASLTPGTGYTMVAGFVGADSQILIQSSIAMPGPTDDEVAVKSSPTGQYVAQPMTVPFQVKGPYQTTSTIESSVINRVSLSVTPEGGQSQQRSASVLSQAYTDDPWLGVAAGETIP